MTTHTFGSLFAGVGGFDLGMEAAGWTCSWQVEWDKQCQQVLRHHWPDVAKYGDVSDVDGTTITPVDCITFGSPCQDLSVAGKRAGLDGNRSGLFYEAIRIIKEMRDATGSVQPRWAVWENVVGALSSNRGHDFAAVIDSLAEAGALVIEWAVLDAQHFGVPQRRRRVFVIACFDPATADRCGDPLLPVAESLPRDTPAKRTKGQGVASALTKGLGTGGPDSAHALAGWLVPEVVNDPTDDVVGTISGGGIQARTTGRTPTADCSYPCDGVVSAVTSKWAKGTGGPSGDECQNLLAVYPIQDGRDIKKMQNGLGVGAETDPSYTLDRTGAQAVATYSKSKRAQTSDDDETWVEGAVAPTLNQFDQGDTRATVVAVSPVSTSAVRRLTPVECERLMGWPDDHTRWGVDDNGNVKEMSDSPRYRMIGNGVASPVAAWIGKHLLAVDGDL